MPRFISLDTPENVKIDYELAGLGSRGTAIIIDGLIQFAMIAILAGAFIGFNLFEWNNLANWAIGLIFIMLFLIFFGYHLFFELIWNGQTPGKRLLNIRAIREEGMPADSMGIAIRNIVRILDFLPSVYLIGILFAFFSAQNKRVGDYAAGTLVVKEIKKYEKPKIPDIPEVSEANIILDSVIYDTLKRFIERLPELDNEIRLKLATDLSDRIYQQTGISANDYEDKVVFLENIYKKSIRIK
ncbi:MAG: RDD family protein [Armatimonadota bacterium]